MENLVTLEPKTVSNQTVDEARVLQFLREVKEANPLSVNIEVHTPEWIHDYPDIEQLIAYAGEQGLVDAIPNKTTGQDGEGRSYFWSLTVRPKLVKILKESRAVHRQVTVDGQHFDLRNGINQEIVAAKPEYLNTILIPCWIKNLQDPYSRKRNASERALQKTVALRGSDVTEENLAKIRSCLCEVAAVPVGSEV